MKPEVHPRVTLRHPELAEDDVLSAWAARIAMVRRETYEQDFYVAVGCDSRGRLLEMVAVMGDDGRPVIFHAMTPPSKKTMRELRMVDQR